MVLSNIENIDSAKINNNNKISIVNRTHETQIDLKNNSQSNFSKDMINKNKFSNVDNSKLKELEQNLKNINSAEEKNKTNNYFEKNINSSEYLFDKDSGYFVSKKINQNNLVLSQYPTEEMIRLKIYMLKNDQNKEIN